MLVVISVASVLSIFNPNFSLNNQLIPHEVWGKKRVYSLFTSGFIHSGPRHFLSNIACFSFLAFEVEHFVGGMRFALIYLMGLILSNLCTVYAYRYDSDYRCLGASGPISSLLISYTILSPKSEIEVFDYSIIFPMLPLAIIFLAYSLIGVIFMSKNVNHCAHLFGGIWGGVVIELIQLHD